MNKPFEKLITLVRHLNLDTEPTETEIARRKKIAQALYMAAFFQKYKAVSLKDLLEFIDYGLEHLDEQGLFSLVKDARLLDEDTLIHTALRPSYALLACCIYAANEIGDSFLADDREKQMALLWEGSCMKRFNDHGFGEMPELLDNLTLLSNAGIKNFVLYHPTVNAGVETFVTRMIDMQIATFARLVNGGEDIYILTKGIVPVLGNEMYRKLFVAYHLG